MLKTRQQSQLNTLMQLKITLKGLMSIYIILRACLTINLHKHIFTCANEHDLMAAPVQGSRCGHHNSSESNACLHQQWSLSNGFDGLVHQRLVSDKLQCFVWQIQRFVDVFISGMIINAL